MTPTGRLRAGRSESFRQRPNREGADETPEILTVLVCATISLWAVALLAYIFGQGMAIIVAAFVLGCIAAWVVIIQKLD
jgi:hypothetical protein